MKEHEDLGSIAQAAFGPSYAMARNEIGDDARLSKKGMKLHVESGEIAEVGHYCVLRMKAPFGLMRMETLVIAPTQVDTPLINLDWMGVFGTEMLIAELYDDQIAPLPPACQAELERACASASDLEDAPPTEERWYSSILYPFSCHKKGKGQTKRFNEVAQDYLASYVAMLPTCAPCDGPEKREKVRAYAQRLFDEGGPAVDFVKKSFGEESARRLVLKHMYGVE